MNRGEHRPRFVERVECAAEAVAPFLGMFVAVLLIVGVTLP